jgi:hypothetical protein
MAAQVAQIANTTWTKVQGVAVLVLCIATAMILPMSLAFAGVATV